MPYISRLERTAYDKWIATLAHEVFVRGSHPGALNYVLTSLISKLLAPYPVTYERLNAAIGVLECAKLELYRRVLGPYEDYKREVTGEVYDSRLITDSIGSNRPQSGQPDPVDWPTPNVD
jgi:hypothetical protein